MKKLAMLALPIALAALTACGDGEPKMTPSQVTESAFLGEFKKLDAAKRYDDAGMVKVGKSICGDLKAGGDFPELVKILTNAGIEAREAGAIIGASTAAYCPQYNDIGDAYRP